MGSSHPVWVALLSLGGWEIIALDSEKAHCSPVAADRGLELGPLDQPYPIRFPVAHHGSSGSVRPGGSSGSVHPGGSEGLRIGGLPDTRLDQGYGGSTGHC